jgi:hypothetical protein
MCLRVSGYTLLGRLYIPPELRLSKKVIENSFIKHVDIRCDDIRQIAKIDISLIY